MHLIGGIWGQISVGLFAQPYSSAGRAGLLMGKQKGDIFALRRLINSSNFFFRWRNLSVLRSALLGLLPLLLGIDSHLSHLLDRE